MKILKTFCSRNFGDKLTVFLLERLIPCRFEHVSYRRIYASDLIGIGSILQCAHENYKGVIWTSGFMFEDNFKRFSQAKVIGVRGKETLNKIEFRGKEKTVLGDGGLLCCMFINSDVSKKYKLGIIPHYVDKNASVIKRIASMSSEVKIIDISGSCEDVIKEAQQCECIISSSLHGVILADSIGIPNDWIKLSDNVLGDGFKFRDYYSVFDIENKVPMLLLPTDNFNSVLDRLRCSHYERKNIDVIKSRLLKSVKEILI
jgi:pyruvyltransferase